MIARIAALALLLMASPAWAIPVIAPPSVFDHPFSGDLRVIVVPYWQVKGECARLGLAVLSREDACALLAHATNHCVIVLPQLDTWVSVTFLVELIRHEVAHCNGWAPDHPGGSLDWTAGVERGRGAKE